MRYWIEYKQAGHGGEIVGVKEVDDNMANIQIGFVGKPGEVSLLICSPSLAEFIQIFIRKKTAHWEARKVYIF